MLERALVRRFLILAPLCAAPSAALIPGWAYRVTSQERSDDGRELTVRYSAVCR
jgi:hypothetical protein